MNSITRKLLGAAAAAAMIGAAGTARATDCEVTHWWTSGGEAAAVAKFAEAFNATGNKWVDNAIAGGGPTARPIFVSRITGGDPMCATQFNHGRQTEELIAEGLMLDLTDIATAEKWRDVMGDPKLLDSCTVDGKVYCVPINIHSWYWLWLGKKAYEAAGVPVPANWDEFVAAAPKLREKGKIPLAMGQQPWQINGAFTVMLGSIGGIDLWKKMIVDKDADAVRSPEAGKIFKAFADARALSEGSTVGDWNLATAMVINGDAGGQIMGDWAQGDFQVAKQVPGQDYFCLPGLGASKMVSTDGDAFYFPTNKDPEITKVQKQLASLMFSKEVQVSFNTAKGSMPVRTDVDVAGVNDCMKKGLEILKGGGTIIPANNQYLTEDTQRQMEELMVEAWNDKSITAEQIQERYATIIASAD